MSVRSWRLAAALLALAAASPVSFAATITLVVADSATTGFNDPTPATPVGGNTGTTVGEQRLIAFQYAARHLGRARSKRRRDPRPGELRAALVHARLGHARFDRNDPGRERLSGRRVSGHLVRHRRWPTSARVADLKPGARTRAPTTSAPDSIPRSATRAAWTASGWYFGLDNNHGTPIDLVTVLLHEFAHGLGFITLASGDLRSGVPRRLTDVYARHIVDTHRQGLERDDRRRACGLGINPGGVVWDGPGVTAAVPPSLARERRSSGSTAPASIAGVYAVGTAEFGPPFSRREASRERSSPALDAADTAGPTTTDACSAISNAAEVAGKIALIDRGTCGFVVKVKNAQNAGAHRGPRRRQRGRARRPPGSAAPTRRSRSRRSGSPWPTANAQGGQLAPPA